MASIHSLTVTRRLLISSLLQIHSLSQVHSKYKMIHSIKSLLNRSNNGLNNHHLLIHSAH